MSYQYRVLADAPVGYWRLNKYVVSTYDDAELTYDEPGYLYNQVLSNRLYDETVTMNQGFVSHGSSAVFLDVLPLTATSSNQDFAGCKVTDTTALKIRNRPNKYKMFYNGTENLSFSMEFWLCFDDAPATKNSIITVKTLSEVSAEVYAQGDKLYFTVWDGADSYTAYKQVLRWDSQMHVAVSFDGRKIQVTVNAISGETVNLPNSFNFSLANTDSMDVDYQIGPAPSGNEYVINDLAFYDYTLSENLIRNHMIWASNDSRPIDYVKETSGYFFDIEDSELMFEFKKDFFKESDYQEGLSNNLVANETGLTIQKASPGVSSTGTWTYQVSASTYSKVYGAKISWNSGSSEDSTNSPNQYVKVELSYDNGETWKQVKNDYPAVHFDDDSTIIYPNIIVRVTIKSADTSVRYQPRLDNLSIGIYKDLSIFSDLGAFALSPKQGSYIGDTYSIKSNQLNIMSRSKNFGIKLDEVDGKKSIAVITPQEQSPGYQTLEFWFRKDGGSTSDIQYVLDTLGQDAIVYLDSVDGEINQFGLQAVYVNGLNIDLNSKNLVEGEIYHIVCVFESVLNSPLYLGGNKDLEGYCKATYGFIALYPNGFTETDAQDRYLSYLTSKTALVGAGVNSIGSIAEYSGGSTAFNDGEPIFAYITPNV
jgi:hypothetical protein